LPSIDHPNIEAFPVRDVAPKPWGREVLIGHTKDYTGKVMYMHAGKSGPLQWHRAKDETFYLHAGVCQVRTLENGVLVTKQMVSGESYHIPPGCVHQVSAISDCIMFEVSTPVFDDRVPYDENV
jgi:quercetin dioxygenase-like cupin family protein